MDNQNGYNEKRPKQNSVAKRIISGALALLTLVAFLGMVLYGCAKKAPKAEDPAESAPASAQESQTAREEAPNSAESGGAGGIADYAVFPENSIYVYEGETTTFNDWHVFISYVGGGKAQKVFMTSYATTLEVLDYSGGVLKQIYGEAELSSEARVTQFDMRDQAPTADIVLLKEPIAVGTTWLQSEMGGNGITSAITSIDKEIVTPLGTYKCVEVTTIIEEGVTEERDYYAKGVGLIKVVTMFDGSENVSQLAQIMTGQTLSEAVGLFYPSAEGGGQPETYETLRLEFSTNDLPQDLLKKAVQPIILEKFGVDISGVVVNKVVIEPADRQARIDFNAFALALMNTAPDKETEELVIQCATDTLAFLFNVDAVAYTIDGNEYKSDKFTLGVDDFVQVNMREERAE